MRYISFIKRISKQYRDDTPIGFVPPYNPIKMSPEHYERYKQYLIDQGVYIGEPIILMGRKVELKEDK